MSKKNKEVANMLMNAFQGSEKKEQPKITLIDYKNLEEIIEIKTFYDETSEGEIKEFLKDSSVRLFNVKAEGVIAIGEILNEVYLKLSRSEGVTGMYTKWLEANEISPRTALRYRTRYELYTEISDEENKKTIIVLPQVYIDEMSKDENKKTCIEFINSGATPQDIISMLKKDKVEVIPEVQVIETKKEIALPDFLTKSFVKKIENLDKKKHRQALKYIEKLNELLGDE